MLMLVSLDIDQIKADGYVFPHGYTSMITCVAENEHHALDQFRTRTGFNLDAKYVKCRDINTDVLYPFD